MPVYEYRCKSCGKTHEIEHGFNDERPTKCSSCGGQLARVFHPVGVVFKGSGFHKTDYTSSGLRNAGAESGSEGSKADGKPSESKPAETKGAPSKTESATPPAAKPATKTGDSSPPPTSSSKP